MKSNNWRAAALVLAGLVAAPGFAASKRSPAASATLKDIEKTIGFVPGFLEQLPDAALPGTWEEMKTLQMNPQTAIPAKYKELIGLGVSAQIPCQYCIEAHTQFAKMNGASGEEIGEAVAIAGLTRHWSTFLNGIQTDAAEFRREIGKIVKDAQKKSGKKEKSPKPVEVVDGKSALKDIEQSMGMTPGFLEAFPDVARAGAWKTMRDLQMNPNTALSGKYKELVGLAVASQVPCEFCIIAHTEFAKLNGATEDEIREAIAMASLTRHMSTLLNGLQVDMAGFREDLERLSQPPQASAKE